ncbi:YjzD family protein [Paenisporosarcina quisquiliarum]|uniref:YjzD family protein n=1 Tax=Paenisporosarcina quisquiliarum TaxID=365346 RepID=UPI0037351C59
MKFVFTFIWSFLLITLLNYVVSSVNGVPFDFTLGAIVSVGVALLLFVISKVIPNEPVAHEHH